jgi:cell division protein FtsW
MIMQATEKLKFHSRDHWLLASVLVLAAVGLVMVYSASSVLAAKDYMDSTYFLKQQSKHLALGLAVMAFIASIRYENLHKFTYLLMIAILLALLMTLIPGIGHRAGGASRWLRIFSFSLQPAEIAKPVMVIFLARWLADHQHEAGALKTFAVCMAALLLIALPILMEPDLGMTIILSLITVVMLFAAGSKIKYLAIMALASLPVLYLLIFRVSYRLDRITAFLHPWDDPKDSGYQIIHSFNAFGSGGLTGAGLGNSVQKLFYLPEPHTDFIMSVLAEEFGFIGVVVVLALFSLIIWRGLKIALEAKDLFGTFLALGATLIIGLQAFINAGVVMGLLPTKGLTMPFISCGGSSLLANFICVGFLLSVSGQRRRL